jgi:hypothetical protein
MSHSVQKWLENGDSGISILTSPWRGAIVALARNCPIRGGDVPDTSISDVVYQSPSATVICIGISFAARRASGVADNMITCQKATDNIHA